MSAANPRQPSPTSSGASTPITSSASSYYLPSPSVVTSAMSGLFRRFTSDPVHQPHEASSDRSSSFPASNGPQKSGIDSVYTPPYRTASPFQPPPLYPITLSGYSENTAQSAQLLSRALAEEIRLLVPPRLQLYEDWNLIYSLEQDGVSLGTLYKKCDDLRGLRNGFVLVVRDGEGNLFGAYLTEAPHPSPHYYGTGECFLWRASILPSTPLLQNLPPPPSADTTNMQRSTTIGMVKQQPSLDNSSKLAPPVSSTGASTPERIRFKAFPYSGVNDYIIFCEHEFLSVGGGDGHYGLWLDDTLERGISSSCPTFGNEPLSDEGEKFDILGVEIWSIGNK